MLPIVVTTSQRYCDLDALACVLAYTEIDPERYCAVIPGPLNHSITQTIKNWGLKYDTKPPAKTDGYVVMDISEDKFIAEFVDLNKVTELYDHHFGFEEVWHARPWTKTAIVEIGACATLVWEEIKKRKHTEYRIQNTANNQTLDQEHPNTQYPIANTHSLISPVSANLLFTAIVTHTLNFKISITKDRDRQAARELKPYCQLPDGWIPQYYREIEQDVYRDPVFAIANDTKLARLRGQTVAIGQVEMWLPEFFLKENKSLIKSALRQFETELWLYISPCISKGICYLVTDNQAVKEWLKMHLGAIFDKNSDIGMIPKLLLRKDIIKELERE